MKTIVKTVCIIMVMIMVAACMGCQAPALEQTEATPPNDTPLTPPIADNTNKLVIGSVSGDGYEQAMAFADANPHIDVTYSHIPAADSTGDALNGDGQYDVLVVDSSLIKAYVESGRFADLSALMPLAEQLEIYPFVLDAATHEGIVRALSWEAQPGMVFYRRSLAKEYFGTDDADVIQSLMSDMDKFGQMAAVVKQKSGGDTYMIDSIDSLIDPFLSVRQQPWLVDGQATVDPLINALFEAGRRFRQNGYEAQLRAWPSQPWHESISDKLTDQHAIPKQVFCYFLSGSMLDSALMPYSGETAGDWACVPGPLPFAVHGCFAGVLNGCDNADNAMDFIRFAALDADTLTNWATGAYADAYPQTDTADTMPLRFVSSRVVAEQIAQAFGDTAQSRFLDGQNVYSAFASAAYGIRLGAWHSYDERVQGVNSDMLSAALETYASGSETLDSALAQLKKHIADTLS